MSDSEQRNRFADLLEQVVDGKLTATDALKMAKAWNEVAWKEGVLSIAWHTLVHFDIDSDIREKDPQYDEDMKRNLRLHISNLRSS